MLNKIGKIVLLVGFALLAIAMTFLKGSIFFFISLFFISAGLCLVYFESALAKRKKATLVIFCISAFLFFIAWLSKKFYWPSANVSATTSLFLFSFTVLPLFIKSRYQTRNISISTTVLLLSVLDLAAVLSMSLGLLSRILHWSFSGALPIGIVILVVSMICWNLSFRQEVKRRMQAEEKLQKTLDELEEKQQEILSSIRYAKRIQKAHLPSDVFITKNLHRLKDKNS